RIEIYTVGHKFPKLVDWGKRKIKDNVRQKYKKMPKERDLNEIVMAEVAVSLVMEKLTSLLSKDVELLRGIHEEVEDIKVELEFITCFLKEADARAVRDQDGNSINGVETWVKLAVARRDPRVGLQFVQDNGLVGIDSLRNELVDRLISGPSVRTIVSLVGIGGIGKTTLARKVKESPPNAISRMDEEELISKSREYLLDKMYVAVFDDLWNQVISICLIISNHASCIWEYSQKIDSMGQARECRVRDLMREVILSKWDELNLIQTSVGNLESFKGKARHLSLYDRANNNFPGSSSKSQVHSIIAFQVDFKFLKEVDFAGVPLSYVSEELGDLLHLRYSSPRYTKVKMLPESIGKLHNLQSLDLKRSPVHELPAEGNKLYNLQYLAAYYRSVDTLEGDEFCVELGRLKKLKKLGSSKLKPKHGVAFCTAIEQMNKRQSLSLTSIKDEEFLQLQSMSYPPVSLRKLCLRGRLTKLPNWVSKVHNLVRIGLHWSRISDDSLKILGVLPKLLKFQPTNGI
ncbi:hypothetical protein Gorai_020417, partial [Gossypium raimondii]|nr:hypothetical protein [Gossypium raimondii]